MHVYCIYLHDYVDSLMNISGRLLDAFLALAETRRFATAAERCHVSPSAFSQMIRRLEEQVGARLFDRDTRNVFLTPEGEVFARGAQRVSVEMASAMAELKDRSLLNTGRISLAAPPSLCAEWLPGMLAAFRNEHPGIALQLHDVVSDRCLAMISSGMVDFGLNARSGNKQEFEAYLLFNEPLFLICRDTDPLAGKGSVRLRDLRGRDFIHTIRTGSVWQHLQPMLGVAEIHDSGFEVWELGTMAGLIAHGFGISIVAQFALQLCRRQGLAAVPITDRHAVRPIFIIKRRHRSLSPAAQGLWDRLVRDKPKLK
ncbi:HTH-type transcriptional regulator GltC [Pigmentiphaga humi]|uniref:HTH-type transcriptional regulator GltC n=2 Tax=Pigmentiphaga humi TaxID=2478468 RepID=A0A3P4B838_9BURK|nr:HTH-type transcriptional regulator GltC [Pigmentiphaga humi]